MPLSLRPARSRASSRASSLTTRAGVARTAAARAACVLAVATVGTVVDGAGAQQPASLPTAPTPDRWRMTLTVFRAPGTGLEVRRGSLALFAAHYPTIFRREPAGATPGGDRRRTTHFARVGAALVGGGQDARTAPYASLSWAASLSDG